MEGALDASEVFDVREGVEEAAAVRGPRSKLVPSGLVVASSLPAFMAFAYYNAGNALAPPVAEQDWTGKMSILSIGSLPPLEIGTLLRFFVNVAVMLVAASFVLVYSRKSQVRRALPYYVWSIVMLLVFLLAADIHSWARLIILVLPLLWTQADFTIGRLRIYHLLFGAYFVLLCASTAMFADWYQML